MSVVAVADVKRKIAKQTWTADETAELEDIIDAAEDLISARIAAPLTATTYTDEAYNGGSDALYLNHWPVTSVTSITYNGGTAVDLADLTTDLDSGRVTWNYNTTGTFARGTRNVLVTYVAGGLPDPVKRAIVKLAAHMWDQDHGAPSETFGVAPDFDDLPNAVTNMLGPYLRGPSVG